MVCVLKQSSFLIVGLEFYCCPLLYVYVSTAMIETTIVPIVKINVARLEIAIIIYLLL